MIAVLLTLKSYVHSLEIINATKNLEMVLQHQLRAIFQKPVVEISSNIVPIKVCVSLAPEIYEGSDVVWRCAASVWEWMVDKYPDQTLRVP